MFQITEVEADCRHYEIEVLDLVWSTILYLSIFVLYAAACDEQCSLHGGVCDNGVCEFRCSDYAGYTCQNSSALLSSLSVCRNVLKSDMSSQHCAPSESSILQQLEEVVVMPNYHRLFPGGARKLFNIFGSSYCDTVAKRLACWVRCLSIISASRVTF